MLGKIVPFLLWLDYRLSVPVGRKLRHMGQLFPERWLRGSGRLALAMGLAWPLASVVWPVLVLLLACVLLGHTPRCRNARAAIRAEHPACSPRWSAARRCDPDACTGRMRRYRHEIRISPVHGRPGQHLDIARTADDCGWDSIQVADAPFFPETISVPYPYTPDGTRFWPLDMPVLDPWVAITAMAVVTTRIRFLPSVLRLAIRQPLLEAKSLCSVAAISSDRVALGVGLAWMPEEFRWLGVDMKTRGARQDEAIQVIRLLMQGGMQEFHGKHFDFDRLTMAPVPKKRIPIYVGGTTTPALRRAARLGDGWVSVIHDLGAGRGHARGARRFSPRIRARARSLRHHDALPRCHRRR